MIEIKVELDLVKELMPKMGLLNYTTKVPVEQTIAEIEKILADSGARKIMKDYDDRGVIESVSFQIETPHGKMPFRLPMKQKSIQQVLKNQSQEFRKQPSGKKVRIISEALANDPEQAARVGWRIIKDWLEAQMALYFLAMVKIEEIMLPFVVNPITGKTLFETLEENKFKGFLLEDKSDEKDKENTLLL